MLYRRTGFLNNFFNLCQIPLVQKKSNTNNDVKGLKSPRGNHFNTERQLHITLAAVLEEGNIYQTIYHSSEQKFTGLQKIHLHNLKLYVKRRYYCVPN